MVSEKKADLKKVKFIEVLILVLVEDGLRDQCIEIFRLLSLVLILVLVEDGLREQKMQCDDH